MELFLGIDLGTSYFKAGLFDRQGRLCGLGRQAVPRLSAPGGICELTLDNFWSTLRKAITQALGEAGAEAKQIVALSYASQANSFLLLDKVHQPLTPLILWPDERAGDVHPDLQAFCRLGAWRVKTGMGIPLSKHSAVNKLLWYQSRPEVFQKINYLFTISDYLIYVLTGNLYSDLSTSSLMGLLDVQSGDWWPEAIACVLPGHAKVGKSIRTGTAIGRLTNGGAGLLGLHSSTQFFAGGLDHHMASLGAGVHTGNYLSESTGTVLAAVKYADKYLPAESICVAPGLDEEHFFNLCFNNSGAAFLEWYQQEKAPSFTIQQLLQQASLVPPGADGLRAIDSSFEGVQPNHGHGHYVRAILEAAALRLSTVVNQLDPGGNSAVVSTGGGARSLLWTEIKAAITGRTFIIPECSEAACLGAAMTAATGSGLSITGWVKYKSQSLPDGSIREQYSNVYE
jgi:xylulokinase